MNGALLCCRFSGSPNRLQYCGPSQAYQRFAELIRTGRGEELTKGLLSRFEGLYPYLRLIAGKHGLDPFDGRVVEAYWIGNSLLDTFTPDDFRSFLPELAKRGLPLQRVRDLQECVPEGAVPHHAFHVMFVGVGQVTGSVPTTIESMLHCMVSWAEVLHADEETVRVRGPVLRKEGGRFVLSSSAERTANYEPSLVRPKQGDAVAVHWGECVHILNDAQRENLQVYTRRVIDAVNSALPSP